MPALQPFASGPDILREVSPGVSMAVTVNAKSTFDPAPPYKGATRRIEAAEDRVTIIDDLVRSRGGILHLGPIK